MNTKRLYFDLLIPFLSLSVVFLMEGCNDSSKANHPQTYKIDEDAVYQQERYLVKSDTFIVNVIDNTTVVHSISYNPGNMLIDAVVDLIGAESNISNPAGNLTILPFVIPDSTTSWSYYIGVDQAGVQAYAEASSKLLDAVAPYSRDPVAALALGLFSYLTTTQTGENVQYWIVDEPNKELIMQQRSFTSITSGDVVNDFTQMTFPLAGQYYICLANDNRLKAIDVIVKVSAVKVHNYYGIRRIKVKRHLL